MVKTVFTFLGIYSFGIPGMKWMSPCLVSMFYSFTILLLIHWSLNPDLAIPLHHVSAPGDTSNHFDPSTDVYIHNIHIYIYTSQLSPLQNCYWLITHHSNAWIDLGMAGFGFGWIFLKSPGENLQVALRVQHPWPVTRDPLVPVAWLPWWREIHGGVPLKDLKAGDRRGDLWQLSWFIGVYRYN